MKWLVRNLSRYVTQRRISKYQKTVPDPNQTGLGGPGQNYPIYEEEGFTDREKKSFLQDQIFRRVRGIYGEENLEESARPF